MSETTKNTTQVIVRDIRQAGWFWVQNDIISTHGPKIGAYGLAVYNVLAYSARNDSGQAKTTLRQLSSLLGISPQTAMRSLEKLVECGLIQEIKKSLSPSQGPSVYALLSVPIGNGGVESVPIGNGSVPIGNGAVPIGNTNKTNTVIQTKANKELSSLFPDKESPELKNPKRDKITTQPVGDPRHAPVRVEIIDSYSGANRGLMPQWSGREAKLLWDLLRNHPAWTVDAFIACIRNRFESEENLSEEPHSWIGKLPKYMLGPLNAYGKPMTGGKDEKGFNRKVNIARGLANFAAQQMGEETSEKPGAGRPALPPGDKL